MRLHEEYILRNKLSIPVILYDKKSSVFLCSKKAPYRLNVFSITWEAGHNSPGSFYISLKEPVRNFSFTVNWHNSFFVDRDEKLIKWNDYDDKIIEIIDFLKIDWVAVTQKERILTLWKMFLFVYDHWLSLNTSLEFKMHVADSLNQENDLESRITSYKNARRQLNSSIDDYFEGTILSLQAGHSNWLERLIND